MAQPHPHNSKHFQASLQVLDGKNTHLKNPWRRCFAKGIDTLILALMFIPCFWMLTAGFPFSSFSEKVSDGAYSVLILLLFTLALIVYDSILLATWGSTPGKKILGLQVSESHGRPLNWEKSFIRSICVNSLLSLCVLIPILPIIFMLYQKQRLCRTGFTSWDAPEETLVYRT
jgi:uncharacterized RDD family membrane protein YckC